MKDEITEFFGNLENITDFSISKQIRKQTNNLDPNEFCKLSLEYKNYCRSRVFHEQMLPKKTDELSKALEENTKNFPDFFSILPVKYYAFENGKIQQKVGSINPNPIFNFNCKYLYYEFESFQNIMHELFEIIKSKETTIDPTQQKEISNTDEVIKIKLSKPKKDFIDFFNVDINISVVEKIQKEFKDYDNKKMAYLIYLLHKEFNLINYSVNSRDLSRKHFVESLIGKSIKMQGVNKWFEVNDVKLKISDYHKDNDYITIKEKLEKTIK